MLENVLERKRQKKRAREKMLREGRAMVNDELNKHEERQLEAINRNMMVGEDYRSQALNHYHRIKELEETILVLKAEPYLLKKRFLALKTKMRREGEQFLMQMEDEK